MGRKQECGLLVSSALGITGKAGLRVWIEYFLGCHLISVQFEDVSASVLMGRLTHPYPCLAGLLPMGMRVVAIFTLGFCPYQTQPQPRSWPVQTPPLLLERGHTRGFAGPRPSMEKGKGAMAR